MPQTATIFAPAKLNLALAVGPRRSDGMHPICSWMVTIDLCDEIELTRLMPDRFSRYAILWHEDARRRSDIDWSITKDLAVRAHLALEERLSRRLPVQMKLQKRIPVGGGLGGGSSDAAAMLHALNELFELGLTIDDLAETAAKLGADVPFLIHGGSAIVEGLGERIDRHEQIPELHAVIVFPNATCPTGRVYSLFDETDPGHLRADAIRVLAADPARRPQPDGLFNDLAPAAIRVAPQLEEDLAQLSELAERPAHLSGSGSIIFIICDDHLHAEFLAELVQEKCDLPAIAVKAAGQRACPPAGLPRPAN